MNDKPSSMCVICSTCDNIEFNGKKAKCKTCGTEYEFGVESYNDKELAEHNNYLDNLRKKWQERHEQEKGL